MDGFDEFKRINDSEHQFLKTEIKNIGKVNKYLLGVIMGMFAVMLYFLGSINFYSKKAFDARSDTYSLILSASSKIKNTSERLDSITKVLTLKDRNHSDSLKWATITMNSNTHRITVLENKEEKTNGKQ